MRTRFPLSSAGFVGLVGRISVFIGKSCGVLYLAAIALSAYEVFMRYALDAPTAWTNETVMTLCATAWLLSVGAVTQQNRHITVTVMELVVPHAIWRRLALFAIVASLLAAAGLLYAGWEPAQMAVRGMERSGSAFNPPMPAYLKAMLLVACGLYILQLLANLIAGISAGGAESAPDVPPVSD